jgi:hypothetical protein
VAFNNKGIGLNTGYHAVTFVKNARAMPNVLVEGPGCVAGGLTLDQAERTNIPQYNYLAVQEK